MAPRPPARESTPRTSFQDLEFRFDPAHRVALPDDPQPAHDEEQSFDQVWLWALLGFETVFVLIILFAAGLTWVQMIGMMALMVVPLVLLSSFKLFTRIDDEGIHFRMRPFHWRWKTIPWDEVDQVYVRKYSPVKEYGGWGIRFGPAGTAYNVRGSYGIQIVRKNGRRILIGTQHPEEASREIGKHMLLV